MQKEAMGLSFSQNLLGDQKEEKNIKCFNGNNKYSSRGSKCASANFRSKVLLLYPVIFVDVGAINSANFMSNHNKI
jgi:hypothetical protein